MKAAKLIPLISLFLFIVLFPISAPKAEDTPDNIVHIQLIPEFSELSGGDTLKIAILQTIFPQWHTYWINPGDSGEATSIDWQMPEGFVATPIQYPVPHKIPIGPLVNFGFEEQAILIQEIKIPENIPEGAITFTANVALLTCKDICIPEFSEHSLTFNDNKNEVNTAIIEQALSKLPYTVDIYSHSYLSGKNLIIEVTDPPDSFKNFVRQAKTLSFFPFEWGVTSYSKDITFKENSNIYTFEIEAGERSLDNFDAIDGLIANNDTGFHLTSTFSPTSLTSGTSGTDSNKVVSFTTALLMAFLGGLILNLMPCVFPVLSIKALSLCKLKEKEAKIARLNGLSYTFGVLCCFAIIAGILISLKSGGASIGWGFHLQNPLIVVSLSWLLFFVGLNFSGYLDFNAGFFARMGGNYLRHHGLFASFLTGVLAVFVATPCTVPFMGVAMGYALINSNFNSFIVFMFLGLGLSFPYLLLSMFPRLQMLLPRPGEWMNSFKELLAFPMYASAVWLIWVYTQQLGDLAVLLSAGGIVSFIFSLWLFKKLPNHPIGKLLTFSVALSCLLSPIYLAINFSNTTTPSNHLTYIEYSKVHLDNLLQNTDEPVFVNMTAAWCITCKLNERVALHTSQTVSLFKKRAVSPIKGDWTNYNSEISEYLESFGREGVPIYVYYGQRDTKTGKRPEPIILPQLLTPAILKEYLKEN
jgi:thiol:disulfide interchange protein DsbD